ncbi:cyclopropane mycolic acid synthase family methyltransferase [Mycobacterium sp. 1423905.2]|uniref:cyclopropane mycolic acid synthase family methyltransferase n=1 Tax=Mycobacterium sp. 1423905.2 TaxID=1856859 RepID=UPI0007FE48A8|nr:cyclopropane mycolic acid synthase family methyltransferase [Mycobacterium sp. 1423905.2]OBJ62519.1 SAM-dependent methyltransferase [Mycobacterium sp. 1423905.2]
MADYGSSPVGVLRPQFELVQAHYDLSDTLFALFQDPSRTYSCAYFEHDGMTLEQAQLGKLDMCLNKLDLQPGMTLLDIGCGWGSAMRRAMEKYDVNVVGLTLSKKQHAYTQRLLGDIPIGRSHTVLLRGWEEFDEPTDGIVSIEAFEAFGRQRYAAFFEMAHRILPPGGRMVLQTIFAHPPRYWRKRGIHTTTSDFRFMRFISQEIFPGGEVPLADDVVEFSSAAGFSLQHAEILSPHYVRTLDAWAANLAARRDDAIAATSPEVHDRFYRYLTGCADFFRRGIIEVGQFTFAKGECPAP